MIRSLADSASIQGLESDPGNVLAARTLRLVLMGVLIYAIPFYAIEIPFFAVRKLAGSMLFLAVLLAAVVSLVFLQKGKLRTASWIFLSSAWLFASVLVVFSGGISSPGLVIYIPVIVLAAWLLGRIVAAAYTAFYLAMTLALALLESHGLAPPKYFPAPPLSTWIITIFFVAIVIVPLCEVLRTFGEALTKAQQQKKRLEESEARLNKLRSLRSLAMGVAHDFNNRLGGVLAWTELALRGRSDPSLLREDLEGIKAAAQRGAEIVDQLMSCTAEEITSFEAVGPAKELGTAGPPATEQVVLKKRTVLVVDDDALLRTAVVKGLQRKGCVVIEAADGQAALNALLARENRIDLILLDLTLPGTSSREVLEQAERMVGNPKVVLMSAYPKQHVDTEIGAVGSSYFIRKPFQMRDLEALIERILHA